MINILAWGIIIFICFCFAPFMTIGVIFLLADWGVIGGILAIICFILGIIHMIGKINN